MDGKVRNFFANGITYNADYLRLTLKMPYIRYHHPVRSIEIVIRNISRHIDIGSGSAGPAYERTAGTSAEGYRTQKCGRQLRVTYRTQAERVLKMLQENRR